MNQNKFFTKSRVLTQKDYTQSFIVSIFVISADCFEA